MVVTCHSCGVGNELPGPPGRRDVCSGCGAELRCCLQCKLYQGEVLPPCKEPLADVPRDRDRANFCEYFVVGSGARKQASDAEKAKAAFEALFKKR